MRSSVVVMAVAPLTGGDGFGKVLAARCRRCLRSGLRRIVPLKTCLKETIMAKARVKTANFSNKEIKRLTGLLADVSRATELRPENQRSRYREAQNSVVTAKRKAEARAGQLRIA
jgi:hypothetical protein